MATKEELIAFADAHGIAVDMSMLKSDIEAAISDAGYDPYALEEDVSDEGTNGNGEEDAPVSRDARFSTYQQADAPKDAPSNPPDGPQVEQHLGIPSESSE